MATWDGFARLSREGEGLVALFANESSAREVQVNWPAPEGSFRFRSLVDGRTYGPFSAEVLTRGVSLPLAAQTRADVLEVTRVEPGEPVKAKPGKDGR